MPLTEFQRTVLADLATNPTDERYLAGGASMHFAPNSTRYSDDLNFFHDSESRVASAFGADRELLEKRGYRIETEQSLPGFVRALVTRERGSTRVDWARDSTWRFLPLMRDPLGGLLLSQIDLAANKILALAGRDEPRDFVDIMFVHKRVLPFVGLCWAAPGKDPGFTPLSLLDLLGRRGRYHQQDFERLQLAAPFDLVSAKTQWLEMLESAEHFVRSRPPEELGCLYYSKPEKRFVVPHSGETLSAQGISTHFGQPGGVVPRVADERINGEKAPHAPTRSHP